MDDKRDWILSQIDVNGRRICEKMNWSESPLRSRSGGGMEIGDFIWHFYISLWSFHTLTLVLRRLTNPKEYLRPQMELFSILRKNSLTGVPRVSWVPQVPRVQEYNEYNEYRSTTSTGVPRVQEYHEYRSTTSTGPGSTTSTRVPQVSWILYCVQRPT